MCRGVAVLGYLFGGSALQITSRFGSVIGLKALFGFVFSFLRYFDHIRSALMSSAVYVIGVLGRFINRATATRTSGISTTRDSQFTSYGGVEEGVLTRTTSTLGRCVATCVARLIRRCVNAGGDIVVGRSFAYRFNEIPGSASIAGRHVIYRICAFR